MRRNMIRRRKSSRKAGEVESQFNQKQADLRKGVPGVEERQFVPLQTLDMLHNQGEMLHGLQTQLGLQLVQHVLEQQIC